MPMAGFFCKYDSLTPLLLFFFMIKLTKTAKWLFFCTNVSFIYQELKSCKYCSEFHRVSFSGQRKSEWIEKIICAEKSSLFQFCQKRPGPSKVIIEKSCSEVSLMEQDTTENVSEPISFFFF